MAKKRDVRDFIFIALIFSVLFFGQILVVFLLKGLRVENYQQMLANMILVISIFVGFFSTSLTILIPISEMPVFQRIRDEELAERLVWLFIATIATGFVNMLIYLILSNAISGCVCFDMLNAILFTFPFIVFFTLSISTFFIVARIVYHIILKPESSNRNKNTDTKSTNHRDMFGK